MITVTLNGKRRQIEGPLSVTAFLETLDIKARQVAVAIGGEVVPRSEWPRVTIDEGGGRLIREAFARCGGQWVDLLSTEGADAFYRSFQYQSFPGYRIYPEP